MDSWQAPVDDSSESKHVVGHDVSFNVVVSKSAESAGCTAKLEADGDEGVRGARIGSIISWDAVRIMSSGAFESDASEDEARRPGGRLATSVLNAEQRRNEYSRIA